MIDDGEGDDDYGGDDFDADAEASQEEPTPMPLPPEVRASLLNVLVYAKDAALRQIRAKTRFDPEDVAACRQINIVRKYLS